MRIRLVAVGTRMPRWAADAYHEFATRMPAELRVDLVEIPTGKRDEGARILAQIPGDGHVVALDERGSAWTTRELAEQFTAWRESARPLVLIIGGPDGLAADVRDRAAQVWSLSKLTLPHMLVRVVVAEQLYRAWTILSGHPYHRD
ncbi:MAG: 23S rRNA (pseudouridine(1915)-N(3))-methyltransferase RlmH [Gammaproteobacteria bacterium]